MSSGTQLVLLTLGISTIVGLVVHFRSGHIRKAVRDVRITQSELGQPLASKATFIQFSSTFCQPCRATKLLLKAMTSDAEGIGHIEVNAESNLELVRKFHVTRTPTTLVADAQGKIIGRAVGVPRKQEVLDTIKAFK